MNRRLRPFLIVGSFWLLAFGFALVGFTQGWGAVTGNAVYEGSVQASGIQSVIITILFFTNIVTLFFLVRAMADQ